MTPPYIPAALAALCAASFALSWLLTLAVKRLAPRFDFVDKPGHRKIHHTPKPLGGGIAITAAVVLPLIAALVAAHTGIADRLAGDNQLLRDLAGGIRLPDQTRELSLFLAAILAMHVMGLFDDRKALGPYLKLSVQLTVTALLVIFSPRLRLLDNLGPALSITLTVLWITAITNAFNFLDNMDGLSAGIAAVCTVAFLVATASIGQWFVAATLATLLGGLLGFLCFNFAPASIFMGDSGSLVIGLVLGTLTVRTTFLPPDKPLAAGWYAVLAPVIVLAVPLYDLVVVSAIRISRGKSPFVGDTNHFSHRLVARGMSKRTAVLCLYLITAATAIAAILLPHVDSTFDALLIFTQTVLILGVVMLLEQHPLPKPKDEG